MRAYVLTLLHVWRIVEGGSRPATDPWFVGFTVIVVVMTLWAWRLLCVKPR